MLQNLNKKNLIWPEKNELESTFMQMDLYNMYIVGFSDKDAWQTSQMLQVITFSCNTGPKRIIYDEGMTLKLHL